MAYRPLIMGVVNLTPDSFFVDSRQPDAASALAHARRLCDEGADWLDVGAESSRPGAQTLPAAVEWARLEPVLKAVLPWGVPVSIDTRKPEIMQAGLALGAHMINDISGFTEPRAIACVADSKTQASVCVMHMAGEPNTMQQNPIYDDVVGEVDTFLEERSQALRQAGVPAQRIWVDPGIGFGKTVAHNLALLRQLPRFARHGAGLLLGVSRKSLIGALTGRSNPADRLAGSLAAALYAVAQCAPMALPLMLRVHDVAATRDALAVWAALNEQGFVHDDATQSSPAAISPTLA